MAQMVCGGSETLTNNCPCREFGKLFKRWLRRLPATAFWLADRSYKPVG